MENIIKLIADNSVGIVCVAVVIYDHIVNNRKTVESLEKISLALNDVVNRLTNLEKD